MENFAVIDLGSNSVRLTITQINDDGTSKEVGQYKKYVRLSAGMTEHDNLLQEDAIIRTIDALKEFKAISQQYQNLKTRAVATAATRNAKNKKKFLRRVENEVGIKIEVLPGSEEARYDYLAVVNTLPVTNCVIMDTGGASTELILVQNRKAQNLISIPIGSVNLSERFLNPGVVTARELFNLISFMNRRYNQIWWLHQGDNLPIVALGGSNRTLAKIERRKDGDRDFENIHGYRMNIQTVDQIFSEIVGKDQQERANTPGLSKDRADIIIGGLVPVVTMMSYLDSDRIIFSQSGLRQGILSEHLETIADRKINSEN